mgnify:CR=1 FL=1
MGRNAFVIALVIAAAGAGYYAWSRSRTQQLTPAQMVRKYSEVLSAEEVRDQFELKVDPAAKAEGHLRRGVRVDWSIPGTDGQRVTFLTITVDSGAEEGMAYLLRQRKNPPPRMLEGLGRDAHACEEKGSAGGTARIVTLMKGDLLVEIKVSNADRVLKLPGACGPNSAQRFSLDGLVDLARKIRPRI